MSKCSTKSLLIKKMFETESSSTRIRFRFLAALLTGDPSATWSVQVFGPEA